MHPAVQDKASSKNYKMTLKSMNLDTDNHSGHVPTNGYLNAMCNKIDLTKSQCSPKILRLKVIPYARRFGRINNICNLINSVSSLFQTKTPMLFTPCIEYQPTILPNILCLRSMLIRLYRTFPFSMNTKNTDFRRGIYCI